MSRSAVRSLGQSPRILIIKPSSLGDVVHALPVLAALRRWRPRAHIAWLVGTSFAPLLENHSMIDEVILFDRARYGRMLTNPRILAEFARFSLDLRRRRFDLVIDLQGLARSAYLTYTSGAKHRVGFAAARELAWFACNHRVRCPPGVRHAVDRNLRVAEDIGADPRPVQFPIEITTADRSAAGRKLFATAGSPVERFIAVLPGARWESKLWPASHFAELINRIHSTDLPRCVLLGAPDDRPRADQIAAGLADRDALVDLVGATSLRETTALIDAAACVVCLDSGPMHIAAALGRPLVALFGSTDPSRTGPYRSSEHMGESRIQVLIGGVECAPCLKRTCKFPQADSAHRMACLAHIKPDQVERAVATAIQQSADAKSRPHGAPPPLPAPSPHAS